MIRLLEKIMDALGSDVFFTFIVLWFIAIFIFQYLR